MKVIKLILWTILHALSAYFSFFVFAFISAMIFGESPDWVPFFVVFLCLGTFVFLTVLRIKILFPKKKNADTPVSMPAPEPIAAPAKANEELTEANEKLVVEANTVTSESVQSVVTPKKFCQHCGAPLDMECVVCTSCGKQVATLKFEATALVQGERPLNKWVSFLLCLFLGEFGFHKFYEGKVFLGIIYFCTWGLFCVGALVDLIVILTRPNPYYK